MFDYRFEISIDAGEELPYVGKEGRSEGSDTFIYDNLYYGFAVKDKMKAHELDYRTFVLSGTSTLEDLKTMFTKLAHEILESEMPAKHFKAAIVLLQATLNKQFEEDYEDNATCTITRNYPVFGIQFDLHKLPAPVKKPEPDGTVTGYWWNVCLPVKGKNGKIHCIQDDIFCIKPESAVREALDRFFRKYPGTWAQQAIADMEIQASKNDEKARKFPFVVTP